MKDNPDGFWPGEKREQSRLMQKEQQVITCGKLISMSFIKTRMIINIVNKYFTTILKYQLFLLNKFNSGGVLIIL